MYPVFFLRGVSILYESSFFVKRSPLIYKHTHKTHITPTKTKQSVHQNCIHHAFAFLECESNAKTLTTKNKKNNNNNNLAKMMLTTSLRPFHVLDSALASELDDLFFDAVDAIAVPDAILGERTTLTPLDNNATTRYHHYAKREHRRAETKETNRGTLIQMNVPGASSKDVTVTARGSGTLQSKGVSISNVPTSSITVALPSSSLEIKLRRKATHDIENAKAAVMDGVLRIAVPKITIPVVAIPIASGVLFPKYGILLTPSIAALLMAISSITVVINALSLD